MTHTPGTWDIETGLMTLHTPKGDRLDEFLQIVTHGADGSCRYIADLMPTIENEELRPEVEANARLISEAPRMYEVLSNIMGYLEAGQISIVWTGEEGIMPGTEGNLDGVRDILNAIEDETVRP